MARGKKHTPQQIVNVLRQIDVDNGQRQNDSGSLQKKPDLRNRPTIAGARNRGGQKVDQAKRLNELEQENSKLKRLVAELSLDKQILQDIARGNF